MAGKTEKEERKTLRVAYHGTPKLKAKRQAVHILGLRIPKRGKITEADVPRDFPLTLDELAKELKKIPGMEVE